MRRRMCEFSPLPPMSILASMSDIASHGALLRLCSLRAILAHNVFRFSHTEISPDSSALALITITVFRMKRRPASRSRSAWRWKEVGVEISPCSHATAKEGCLCGASSKRNTSCHWSVSETPTRDMTGVRSRSARSFVRLDGCLSWPGQPVTGPGHPAQPGLQNPPHWHCVAALGVGIGSEAGGATLVTTLARPAQTSPSSHSPNS